MIDAHSLNSLTKMAVILIHITNFYIGLMRHTFKIALLFIYIFNGFILSCNTGLPTSKKRVQSVHFHIYMYMYVSQLRVTLITFSKKKYLFLPPTPSPAKAPIDESVWFCYLSICRRDGER